MRLHLLTLSDVTMGLTDLLETRHPALVSSRAGQTYEPMLAQKRAEIASLPATLTGKPLAVELASADQVHDAYGNAIWHLVEAHLLVPGGADRIDAARRIRASLVPRPSELSASYATEADLARSRRASLGALKADLDLFPVGGGRTLFDWASSFLDAGDALSALLSQRADQDHGARRDAGRERGAVVGLLKRFRSALADEVAFDASLPRDLEGQVFGYFDQLAGMRAANLSARKATAAPESPPDATAPAGTTSTPTTTP